MGYRVDEDWSHQDGRKLVFIGDLIDRGPASLEVAQLVKRLCERGDALCLMGNHELNLVEWYHGRTKPKRSNRATIEDVKRREGLWRPILDFFESLPLAIELQDLRATHAVWHQGCLDELEPILSLPAPSHTISPPEDFSPHIKLHTPFAFGKHRPGLPDHQYVDESFGLQWERSLEILLKGHETDVPEPFLDNEGNLRSKIRAEWWHQDHPEVPKDKRIVFGHYWNMPPIANHHQTFVPPHPSGHPKLRAWFDTFYHAVENTGMASVPEHIKAVCIDYHGVTRAKGGRPCVGAYRYPESKVAWAKD